MAPDAASPRASYDRIAHLYDYDMGRNMAFDDVALYAQLAERAGGRVLELGCGNGRVLLELLARGIHAIGIDLSLRMLFELERKAIARGLTPAVCLMDARTLGFTACFALVLCPYSLITYMTTPHDAVRMLASIRSALLPQAMLILDAFIPRASALRDDFHVDYRRDHPDGMLVRSKRIATVAPGVNRIERRYELLTLDGRLLERIETREEVRPYTPEDLAGLLSAAGFTVRQLWWDYRAGDRPPEAQFVTMSAQAPLEGPYG
jgi:SAM-dependent methyltransferase